MPERLIDIPNPGDRGLRRYSTRAFPVYRYVPGLHPHPHRDPAGHSYEPVPGLNRHAPWSVDDWQSLDDWLYGVDLFNWFYFWEAHEAWEGLWTAAESGSAPSLLLQGLIQIAAALLKTHMGVLSGARVLSAEGLDKLRRSARLQPVSLGLRLPEVVSVFTDYFAPVTHDQLPQIGPHVPMLQLATTARARPA